MEEYLNRFVDDVAARVPIFNEGVEIGADGLKHCAKCGGALQVEIEFLGTKKILPCICQCEKDRMKRRDEEIKERERLTEISRLRQTGFKNSDFATWTFANDDGKNPKIKSVAENYVKNWDTIKEDGKGILFYGTVGTGKTYAAACIANALIDACKPVLMTNFSRIINKLQSSFEGRQEYLDGLNEFDLLILDDLSAERKTEYVQEIIYNVIDTRYRAKKPLIITTNLTIEELKNPESVATARIYDRILERCFPVEVAGASHRRQKIAAEYDTMREMLGL